MKLEAGLLNALGSSTCWVPWEGVVHSMSPVPRELGSVGRMYQRSYVLKVKQAKQLLYNPSKGKAEVGLLQF